jgi:hypothetical protein
VTGGAGKRGDRAGEPFPDQAALLYCDSHYSENLHVENYTMHFTGLGLVIVGIGLNYFHGFGQPVDVVCPKDMLFLPACGSDNEGPSAPPMAAAVAITSSTNSAIVTGGTFFDAVTDDERAVPPKPTASITRST